MQRGEDEDKRERVRRCQQQPDDAEREQRAAVSSEPFLRPDRPPRQKTAACDEPACSGEQDQREERSPRPGDGAQRRCMRVTTSPEAERPEDEKDCADPRPEAEPAAIAAKGGCDADPASATAGEEVDGGREEGQ